MVKKQFFLSKFFLIYFSVSLNMGIPSYAASKSELLQREEEISQKFNDLQKRGRGSEFIYKITEQVSVNLEAELALWNHELSNFYGDLDSFILDQQKFFLDETYENIKILVSGIEGIGRYKKDIRFVRSQFLLLDAAYKKFYDNLSAFATGKDYRRINAYVAYFEVYRNLLRHLGYVEKSPGFWTKKLSRTVIRNGVRNPGLIKEVFRPKSRPHGSAPLTELINREGQMLRDIFDALEMQVDISGQENIPEQNLYHLGNHEEVNIFAHQHGHGIIDELVKAHIPIPHYMVMWAVKIGPIPRFMQQYLERSPSIIPVGAEKDPLTSTMERLDQRFSDNIAIHPQGELNIFNEVMPVHKNFSYRYIKTLRDHGYRINLIPVSSQYAPVFLSGNIDDMKEYPDGNHIKVSIEKKISPQALDVLLSSELGYDSVLHLLRLIWLEKAVSNKVQILGGLRTQVIEDKLRKQIGDFVRADSSAKGAISHVLDKFLECHS